MQDAGKDTFEDASLRNLASIDLPSASASVAEVQSAFLEAFLLVIGVSNVNVFKVFITYILSTRFRRSERDTSSRHISETSIFNVFQHESFHSRKLRRITAFLAMFEMLKDAVGELISRDYHVTVQYMETPTPLCAIDDAPYSMQF